MKNPPFEKVSQLTFSACLQYAIVETWRELRLLESEPERSPFHLVDNPVGIEELATLDCYLLHLIDIARWRSEDNGLSFNERSSKYLGQFFMDAGTEFRDIPLMRILKALDHYWIDHGNEWDVPPEGVLNDACRAVVAEFPAWSVRFNAERLARINAKQKQRRDEARARLPPTRLLPHDPDPDSIDIYRQASRDELAKWQPRLPGTDGLGNPTAETARHLAEQHLIAALTGHWFLAPVADTLAAMRRGCDYAVRGLPSDPVLHAWTYEQWQHLAIVAQHQPMMDLLWSLRREDWDTNRIRPVNWLICRIRLLDLLHRGGGEDEVRDLLEKQRLGLFVEQLPSELEVDLPLMRNWYHIVRGIVLRDQSIIDQRLAERQGLLAEHWTRGGGIAPVSLLDVGGWALLRTARLRGLKPAVAENAYLPREVLDA